MDAGRVFEATTAARYAPGRHEAHARVVAAHAVHGLRVRPAVRAAHRLRRPPAAAREERRVVRRQWQGHARPLVICTHAQTL